MCGSTQKSLLGFLQKEQKNLRDFTYNLTWKKKKTLVESSTKKRMHECYNKQILKRLCCLFVFY